MATRVWKAEPDLLVVMAQVQTATAEIRIARASMPIECDDAEEFRGTYLGVGEKLVMPLPPDPVYTEARSASLVSRRSATVRASA